MIDNINQHIISNAAWCILFLLISIMVVYITHHNNRSHKKNTLGYVLFADAICSYAFLMHCYFRMSTSLDNEITKWYSLASFFVSIRDLVAASVIIVFLLQKLVQKTGKDRGRFA